MLKFFRKYQLIVLVVGGSLLMVVFLLQPVLQKLGPNPEKAVVATVGEDAQPITRGERGRAYTSMQMVGAFFPLLLGAQHLNIDPDNPDDHWLLLEREARAGGFVGETEDARTWLVELAAEGAYASTMQRYQQMFGGNSDFLRQFSRGPQFQAEVQQVADQLIVQLDQSIDLLAGRYYGSSVQDIERAIATARGIDRMIRFYNSAPRFSVPDGIIQAKQRQDIVVADFVVLPASQLIDPDEEVSDEDLAAHLERFRDSRPGESDFGIGYKLPPRVKLEFLKLDVSAIAASVKVDRIEMHKRWRLDRSTYPGEFADERDRIETIYRSQRAQELMVAADRIIRAQILQSLAGVSRRNGVYDLPEDFINQRMSLEDIALAVVEQILETQDTEIPLPTVQIHRSGWLTGEDITALPGLGSANYRIGNRGLPAAALPLAAATDPEDSILPVQVGVTQSEPSAEDESGNRYYVTLLEARPESPAESVDEVGREKVRHDLLQLQAYQDLVANAEFLRVQAIVEGLQQVLDSKIPDDGDPLTIRPAVTVEAIFNRLVAAASNGSAIDSRVAAEDIREQIVIAGLDRLDPLAEPGSADPDTVFMTVEIPTSRSLAVVRLFAVRPLTEATYRRTINQVLGRAAFDDIQSLGDIADEYPFTYANMVRRHQYTKTTRGQQDAADGAEG